MSLPPTHDLAPEPLDKVICRLCRRQFSKYTCPTCNVPYCSLVCFRNESHAQCSEVFYKKEVELDIETGPSKTVEERERMMDILRKFENANQEEDPESFYAEGDDSNDETAALDLARKLGSINLDTAKSEALWSVLTPEQRNKFLKAVDNPESELAKQLLASETLEDERRGPWWEGSTLSEDEIKVDPHSGHRFGERPSPMKIPVSMVKDPPSGPSLVFNMAGICIAYAYVTRQLVWSPLSTISPESVDRQEARKIISQLVPFLVDRKGTTLYTNVSSMITDLWSRFDLDKATTGLFSVLLTDVAKLLRPLPVVVVHAQSTSDVDVGMHAHTNTLLVLSDLIQLFNSGEGQAKHISHKLMFYAGHIISTPSLVMRAVSEEAATKARNTHEDTG
ncbi:hypothetical protein BDN72DRAFT_892650 [Pluteus cervinus]|uniref:Uncharacterized protein n=1 Tax=Pluteus cervinus TaxID=181527 RepID=A0ACD3BB66_9AGAR|nr:hypothetical protein BDN72DRAFT_892650 [Pluteus cervinus]